MQTYIFILLAVSIVLQVVIILQLHWRKAKSVFSKVLLKDKSDITSIVKMLNAYNKMTAVKWYADMMLDGDFGTLHIAQIQFLHQIAVDCDVALKELHDIAAVTAAVRPGELKKAMKVVVGQQKT